MKEKELDPGYSEVQSQTVGQSDTQDQIHLQVINSVQEFKWNFEEVKALVAGFAEKYVGLVVTEENLKDMETAQRELASARVKLDTFHKKNKKLMEAPIKEFEAQIKELKELIEGAETPLKSQIQIYEDARAAKKIR